MVKNKDNKGGGGKRLNERLRAVAEPMRKTLGENPRRVMKEGSKGLHTKIGRQGMLAKERNDSRAAAKVEHIGQHIKHGECEHTPSHGLHGEGEVKDTFDGGFPKFQQEASAQQHPSHECQDSYLTPRGGLTAESFRTIHAAKRHRAKHHRGERECISFLV